MEIKLFEFTLCVGICMYGTADFSTSHIFTNPPSLPYDNISLPFSSCCVVWILLITHNLSIAQKVNDLNHSAFMNKNVVKIGQTSSDENIKILENFHIKTRFLKFYVHD